MSYRLHGVYVICLDETRYCRASRKTSGTITQTMPVCSVSFGCNKATLAASSTWSPAPEGSQPGSPDPSGGTFASSSTEENYQRQTKAKPPHPAAAPRQFTEYPRRQHRASNQWHHHCVSYNRLAERPISKRSSGQ